MTDYIDDIAVDFSIYQNWPDIIKDCAAAYYEEDDISPSYLFIIKDKSLKPQSIIKIPSLDNINAIARMSWRSDQEKFYAFELYVDPEYRGSGVGTFLSILTRTWAADKMGKRAVPNGPLSDDIINLLDNIKRNYELDDIL